MKYSEIETWREKHGLSRFSRLSTAYAVGVQRCFLSGLGRVGMPTIPPMYQNAAVEVWLCQDKQWTKIETVGDGAVVLSWQDGGQTRVSDVSLTENGVIGVMKAIAAQLPGLESRVSEKTAALSRLVAEPPAATEKEKMKEWKKAKNRAEGLLRGLQTKLEQVKVLASGSVLCSLADIPQRLRQAPSFHTVDGIRIYDEALMENDGAGDNTIALNLKRLAHD